MAENQDKYLLAKNIVIAVAVIVLLYFVIFKGIIPAAKKATEVNQQEYRIKFDVNQKAECETAAKEHCSPECQKNNLEYLSSYPSIASGIASISTGGYTCHRTCVCTE